MKSTVLHRACLIPTHPPCALCHWKKVPGGIVNVMVTDTPSTKKSLRRCEDCEAIAKKREGKSFRPWKKTFSVADVLSFDVEKK